MFELFKHPIAHDPADAQRGPEGSGNKGRDGGGSRVRRQGRALKSFEGLDKLMAVANGAGTRNEAKPEQKNNTPKSPAAQPSSGSKKMVSENLNASVDSKNGNEVLSEQVEENLLAKKIEEKNPQMSGNGGNINVTVNNGDVNGLVGHRNHVGGNFEVNNKNSESAPATAPTAEGYLAKDQNYKPENVQVDTTEISPDLTTKIEKIREQVQRITKLLNEPRGSVAHKEAKIGENGSETSYTQARSFLLQIQHRLNAVEQGKDVELKEKEVEQMRSELAEVLWDLRTELPLSQETSEEAPEADSDVLLQQNVETQENEISVYEKIRGEIVTLKGQVEGIISEYPILTEDPVYEAYRSQLEELESKIVENKTMQDEYLLVRSLVSSIEGQVKELESKSINLAVSGSEKKDAMEDISSVSSAPSSDTEFAEDDSDGLFALGQERQKAVLQEKVASTSNEQKLFGMLIPQPGQLDSEGLPQKDIGAQVSAISFRKGLTLALDRLEAQASLDMNAPQTVTSENQEKLRDLVARLAFIPDSGLTQRQVEEIKNLAQETGSFETPIKLDAGRIVEDMYTELNEKLKARGFDLKLGEIKRDKKGSFQKIKNFGVDTFSASSSKVQEKSIDSTYLPDDEVQPAQEESEGIASTYTPPDALVETSGEKLPDYTWGDRSSEKKENIWNFAEGDIEGVPMLPALAELPKERRNHVLDQVRMVLIMSKEWREKVGVKEHPDTVYPGDVLHVGALNELIKEVGAKKDRQ